MATKVIIKKSAVAGKVPSSAQLDYGELAINVIDKKLYSKDNAGSIIELGGGSGSGSGNIDGGDSTSNYGGISAMEGGSA